MQYFFYLALSIYLTVHSQVELSRRASEASLRCTKGEMSKFYSLWSGAEFSYNVSFVRPRAEAGDAAAQYNLGYLYEDGLCVKQDYAQAAVWYLKAAKQGYALAGEKLGSLYKGGRGVNQDYEEAAKWFQMSAEGGYGLAQWELGGAYSSGRGVPKDDIASLKWLRRAANQGFIPAQIELGYIYARGLSVKQDYLEAYFWHSVAAKSDSQYWRLSKKAAMRLSPEEIVAVNERVNAWDITPAELKRDENEPAGAE